MVFFFKQKIYLFSSEGFFLEISFIYWFIPQMATAASTELIQSKEPKSSLILCVSARPLGLGSSAIAFLSHK